MNRFVISFSLLISWPVMAHVPYIEGLDYQESESFKIAPPIEKSLAIYGSFASAKDVDRLTFRLTEDDLNRSNQYIVTDSEGNYGRKLYIDSLVPACSEYAQIQPMIAIIGPAQKNLSTVLEPGVDVPVSLSNDQGIFILASEPEGPVFTEMFSNTSYWEKDPAEFILVEAGDYEVVIWEKNAAIADYVISFGDQEMFGMKEIAQSMKRLPYLRQGKELKSETCRQQLGKN
ncbi:MAG: hypothetical protein ACOH5I_19365 [Oligoflexus sp.]